MAKKPKQFVDPYAAREAGKYDNPIPSREYILDFLKKCGHLVKRDELNQLLGLSDDPERQEALRRRLRAMERDGQIVLTRREGYGLPDKMNLVRGRIIGHRDGFGFLVPDDGSDDLYLSARQMQLVFHGDRVLARVIGTDRRNRREGVIAEVLERNTPSLVGRFFKEKGVAFVVPSNNRITQDILIGVDDESAATSGQIVVVEITRFPSFRQQAIGRITEILGEHMAPGLEIEIAIRNYNLPHVWPDSVQEEIDALQAGVLPSDEEENRVDLQDLAFVTIDGADAKDFDDAVYCERQKKQWRLVVAIADVSHYINPQSELDKEAEARGNSVYFPNSVLPMLPEVLSNELCSLKPKVNRLCMVCDMLISSKGELKRFQFYPAVIHSRARLIYNEVATWLNTNKCPPAYKNLLPHLQNLHSLYQLLRQTREARGAIDFETTETQVIFGPDRKIKQIIPTVRTVAHRIIEECMLLANVSAAHFLLKAKIPTLYRIHAAPAAEKLADLKSFLAELGLRFPNKKIVTPEDYSTLLKLIADRPDAHLIQTVMLRSLSQAIYSPENIGHFGLAFDAYAHFTSPIRRYPDLLVHRAIRHVLAKRKAKNFFYDKVTISRLGEHCSTTERRADEATREVLDWLKCEYMRDRVGESFDGIITNVTGFGLFVELKNIYVEGLVHVTALHNDYYQFDASRHCLQGERTGIVYRLGDRIQVRVGRVDLDQRKIDFELVEPELQKSIKKAKKYKKRK